MDSAFIIIVVAQLIQFSSGQVTSATCLQHKPSYCIFDTSSCMQDYNCGQGQRCCYTGCGKECVDDICTGVVCPSGSTCKIRETCNNYQGCMKIHYCEPIQYSYNNVVAKQEDVCPAVRPITCADGIHLTTRINPTTQCEELVCVCPVVRPITCADGMHLSTRIIPNTQCEELVCDCPTLVGRISCPAGQKSVRQIDEISKCEKNVCVNDATITMCPQAQMTACPGAGQIRIKYQTAFGTQKCLNTRCIQGNLCVPELVLMFMDTMTGCTMDSECPGFFRCCYQDLRPGGTGRGVCSPLMTQTVNDPLLCQKNYKYHFQLQGMCTW